MPTPAISPQTLAVTGVIGSIGGSATVPPTALSHAPHRVSDIHRLYISGGKRYTVGWLNLEGGRPDVPFVILANSGQASGSTSYVVPNVTLVSGIPMNCNIAASGALWRTIPYQNKASTATVDTSGFWAISVNGADQPVVWVDGGVAVTKVPLPDYNTLASNSRLNAGNNYGFYPVYAMPMCVTRSDQVSSLPYASTEATKQLLLAPRSVAAYSGCVVFGGYRLCAPASNTPDNFDNYITFTDVGTPHALSTYSGVVLNIRIGDTTEEAVTGLGVVTTPTDIMGLKGQLVAFTGRKVVLFDGIPPQSNQPQGINFSSTVMKGVGCYAPKSITQTPHGLVFLGSDGHWYIIRGLAGPEKIGKAVWNLFKGMTPRQMRQVAATWISDNYLVVSYPETGALQGNTSGSTFVSPYFGHLDVRGTTSPFTAEAVVNNRQLYLDLNQLGDSPHDLGCRWQGPHVGMMHSCFALAGGNDDRFEVYAGSAIDGSVYQLFQTGLVTDPNPTSPQTTVPIDTVAVTGVFDLGDANVDKTITGFNYGFGTDRTTTVYCSLIVTPSDNGLPQLEQQFTDVINPAGDLLDSTFIASTSQGVSGDSINTRPHRPFPRARGKFFRLIFHESPSSGARTFYSDFSFRFHLNPRRQ